MITVNRTGVGDGMNEGEAAEMISEIDGDGDGQIDFQGVCSANHGVYMYFNKSYGP